MGFMDKIREAAQDVATEAKKATAQGKTKLDQIQTRKKADDAARRLGYLIHAERTKGTAAGPEVDRLVAEITQAQAEIAEAEAAGPAPATPAATAGPADAAGAAPEPPPAPPATSSDTTPGDFKL
jgi:hypothetical protein